MPGVFLQWPQRSPLDQWKQYGRSLRTTVSASTVGLELALSVGLGYLAGDALDGWLGTAPWLMLLMVLLGSTAGFYNLYRGMVKMRTQEDE